MMFMNHAFEMRKASVITAKLHRFVVTLTSQCHDYTSS